MKMAIVIEVLVIINGESCKSIEFERMMICSLF